MYRLSLILMLLAVLHSCNGTGQSKNVLNKGNKNIVTKKTKIRISIKLVGEKLIVKNTDSAEIYNSSNLVRNFSSLSTTINKGLYNDFFLIYDNNATSEKSQVAFHFFIQNNKIFFISKEQVKFNHKNISISKNYYKPINVMNLNYEDLDEKTNFINDKNSRDSKNSLKNYVMFDDKPAFNLVFKYNAQDFFIDYPVDIFKISDINFIDINNSNDIAYYLQEAKIFDESIFILKKIIKKDPARTVAYLNLADAYWSTDKRNEDKEYYEKYISLMKSQNKDLSKIPQRVYDRIK